MELPLYEHIKELRKRIITIIIFLIIFFIIGLFFSNVLIKLVIKDILPRNDVRLVSLTPFEYMLTQIKVGFISSLIVTIPILFYHALIFIKPGLNKKEKNMIRLILPFFILLFLTGIGFCYFIFIPFTISFLTNLSKGIVENIWSIDKFTNFVLFSCLISGLIFQLPLVLWITNKIGIIKIKTLKKYRPYAYVAIFILAAIITPSTDPITQTITAVPLILLYEISLLLIR